MDFKLFKLIGFEVGKGNKKYTALLKEKKTGKIVKISFGDKRYQQYEDGRQAPAPEALAGGQARSIPGMALSDSLKLTFLFFFL